MKTVYWSPFFPHDKYAAVQLMYETPDSLLQDMLPRRNKKTNGDNFFGCHSFLASIKNTFILRLPYEVSFALDKEIGIIPIDADPENMQYVAFKQPSVIDAHTFVVRGNWIFWSEESLIMTSMPAHYHRPVIDGYYVGGSMDIGKWFRPIEGAIQLHENVNTVLIKRNDPIFYVKFETDEPIQLKRFYMTPEIEQIAWGCIYYKRYERSKALNYLYAKFKERKLDKRLGYLIKENS
jgi:hypothetical protein